MSRIVSDLVIQKEWMTYRDAHELRLVGRYHSSFLILNFSLHLDSSYSHYDISGRVRKGECVE